MRSKRLSEGLGASGLPFPQWGTRLAKRPRLPPLAARSPLPEARTLQPDEPRIRHYGFLANGAKRREIVRCRALLSVRQETPEEKSAGDQRETWQETLLRLTGKDLTRCPICKEGRLVERARFTRGGRVLAISGRGRPP